MVHSFSSRVTIAPDVLFRVVGEEAVLLNLKTEKYLGLDPIGTRMWDRLTQAPTVESAYEALLREYAVDSAQLRQDLDEFLGTLLEQGLIRLSSGEVATSGGPA